MTGHITGQMAKFKPEIAARRPGMRPVDAARSWRARGTTRSSALPQLGPRLSRKTRQAKWAVPTSRRHRPVTCVSGFVCVYLCFAFVAPTQWRCILLEFHAVHLRCRKENLKSQMHTDAHRYERRTSRRFPSARLRLRSCIAKQRQRNSFGGRPCPTVHSSRSPRILCDCLSTRSGSQPPDSVYAETPRYNCATTSRSGRPCHDTISRAISRRPDRCHAQEKWAIQRNCP